MQNSKKPISARKCYGIYIPYHTERSYCGFVEKAIKLKDMSSRTNNAFIVLNPRGILLIMAV